MASAIESYAGADRELLALVKRLRDEVGEFAGAMSPADVKARHFAACSLMQSRSVDGKARRR